MIYFVTEAYLKQKTPITQNVSAIEVVKYIEPAACSWMQNILGTYFFDDLLTKYNAQTLSSDEQALVTKIQPAIAWRAAVDCVLGLTYQLKNKGLQQQNGDNSESVEQGTTAFVMRHYEQKAEFFESIARRYLDINKALFPNYTSKLNTDCENALLTPQSDDNFNTDILFI
jgi:hypothetical protein